MIRSKTLISSSLIAVIMLIIFSSCTRFSGNGYRSAWEKYPDSRWVGPELWANRLSDWHISNGRLLCTSHQPFRTVHLMTRRIGPEEGNLMIMVDIQRKVTGKPIIDNAAGILLGAGSELDYRAASLIYNSWGEGAGLFAGIDGEGKVFIRDMEKENEYPAYAKQGYSDWKEAILRITAEKTETGQTQLTIMAVDPASKRIISEIKEFSVNTARLSGNIALVSHSVNKGDSGSLFSFAGWRVRGSRMNRFRERKTGPIVTAQYTLSREILKITAQLMPVSGNICDSVDFQFTDEGNWQTIATAAVDTPSYTATFRLENVTGNNDKPFRLVAHYKYGNNDVNTISGTIKHDPVEKNSIKLLSLSDMKQVVNSGNNKISSSDAGYFSFNSGILFPHLLLTANMKKQKPDLLFFAGSHTGNNELTRASWKSDEAIEDYLYNWYLWCITFRDLTTTIPCITIPDDHDVNQNKLWGCNGKAAPAGLTAVAAHDAGGYLMPSRFVNMVQKTQTSHLPDPVDPEPVSQGIGVFFTECNVGGISFAIIEDRKFKSAPSELLPGAMIINGFSQKPRWNAEWYADVEGATLLGDRQCVFLENWADNWSGGTWMKAVLSQTLWSNMTTLPDSVPDNTAIPLTSIPDSGIYVKGDKIVPDFNSDGWPQRERNRALRIIRKAFALHVCGDPPLASTIRYGIDYWGDAGYAIVSPSCSDSFEGRWFPPEPGRNRPDNASDYTGEFRDGFGNRITVCAVANHYRNITQKSERDLFPTGYSSVIFNKTNRETEMANWYGYSDPLKEQPMPGWPVTIRQADNYGRRIVAWLPEVVTEGITDPVIRIISENTGEIVYTFRINGNSFQPGVFFYGPYTIEAGDPDNEIWKKVTGIQAWTSRDRQKLIFSF